jgi:hypothetical protein
MALFRYVDQEALLQVAYGEWDQARERTQRMLVQYFAGEGSRCGVRAARRCPPAPTHTWWWLCLAAADVDCSGTVSWEEFIHIAGECLRELGVAL